MICFKGNKSLDRNTKKEKTKASPPGQAGKPFPDRGPLQEDFKHMVELVNSIIMRLDPHGRITFLNDYGLKFFGYEKEEILGKNLIGTIVPEVESSGRDLTYLVEEICRRPEEHVINENENRRKDGSRVWVLWTNKALVDEKGRVTGILCIGSDLTARKAAEKALQEAHDGLEKKVRERTADLQKAYEDLSFEIVNRKIEEEALRESETKYRNIVENAVEGIFQISAEGACLLANTALVRMLGHASAEELISATACMEQGLFVSPDDYLKFKGLLEASGYVKGFETQFYKKDGSKTWVRTNVRAIYDDRGSFLFYQGTVEDITIQRIMDGTTRALSKAIEIRDPYTAGHQQRVTDIASAIARDLGCSQDCIKAIQTAALLHDIGKIYVPAEFLSKPGRMSKNELNVLRDHSEVGYEILKDIEYQYPIAQIVLQHHERADGSGYPQGLSGQGVLLEARIIGVADVLESMASHRPYRPSLGLANALEELEKNKGILYDQTVVESCLRLFKEKGFQIPM
jgi:PAS domain S-box-containing protein/putative nucleotidyltransferase with HDIG domain